MLVPRNEQCAGTNLSTSIVTLPALLSSQPLALATQWQLLYDHGVTPMASLASSSAIGFATLAYRTSGVASTGTRNMYVYAAVAAIGLAPYTQILMGNTNKTLMARAKAAAAGDAKADTHDLVRKWGRFNFVRGLMLLSSAVVGAWASLG